MRSKALIIFILYIFAVIIPIASADDFSKYDYSGDEKDPEIIYYTIDVPFNSDYSDEDLDLYYFFNEITDEEQ